MLDVLQDLIRPDASAPALTIDAMVKHFRMLLAQPPQPDVWTIAIPAGVHRDLWNVQSPMRKKLARAFNVAGRPGLRHNVRHR